MKTRVQKWGNSLALRIPKAFAEQVGIDDNALVDISLADGMLLVTPLPDAPLLLDDLLACVTDDNLHQEIDSAPPQGNEIW